MNSPCELSSVQIIGGPSLDASSTNISRLRANLADPAVRQLVKKYGLLFGTRLGGGAYSDVYKVRVRERMAPKLRKSEDDDAVDNEDEDEDKPPQPPDHNKFVVKIVDGERCPKITNYQNEFTVCRLIMVSGSV